MSQAQKDPIVGTRIREYEILELLGKGGMGAVYKARHSYLEEERAIKIIHGRPTGESGFVDRFIREARILTRLRHTNLIQLYEFGTLDADSFFMVMELIRGESLWHRIRRMGRIPVPDAVRIVREAASGLQCAHQNGIIHRDISPDNIILLNDRQPEITKVIDFGIAKPLLETSRKPEYCSPEQCTFSESKVALDARSDIYSLAVTFYQMLTANLPFHSKSPQGYFMKHAHELPDAPSSHFPAGSFPESLDRLILKALSKRREDRHENLGEFLAELDASEERSVSVPLFSEPETHLKEAEEQLSRSDYLAAMASLESAWHLQPNDPEIIRMQEKIQLAQETETTEKHESKLNEAHSLLSEGKDEHAFFLAQEILDENPSHRSAKALRDQILDSRWARVQEEIKRGLELAVQPLSFCDFDVALDLLMKLQAGLEIESCRKEMERIRNAVTLLGSAFETEQYYDVPHIVRKLLAKDPFGWLEAHSTVFAEIETVAAEKLSARQIALRDALSESRNLLNASRHREALSKVEDVLSRWPASEAEELRAEILDSYRESKTHEAQGFAVQLNWERAIESWKEILIFFPDSTDIQQSVSEAEEHLRIEREIQQQLLRELKNCYLLILKESWVEAQEHVEGMLKSIQPGFRLIEIERQIETLQAEILLHNREQQKNMETLSEELSEIRKLHKLGNYSEALEKISFILETEFLQEEVLDLKISIEKAMRAQSVALRFQSAVQKGKQYYELRNWQKAIEFWKKASLLSEETYVKVWIEQAEERLKKERQARLSIIAMLAEAEELIFYNKFTEAGRKLNKCRKALSEEFSLDDLAEQIGKISVRLESEIRQEEVSQASIQSELEEAALLYRQKLYSQALLKLDVILQQQPEMEAATQLKAQIEAEEAENRNVLDITRTIVKLVVKREFKQLPAVLLRLKETSSRTPYAEDCASIVDEMPLLVLELQSGDQVAARERLDRLFSRSLLLLEYQQTLRDFLNSLESRNQKEAEIEKALEEGLELLHSGDQEGALRCLRRFDQVIGGKQQKRISYPADHLDRTITLSDDDMKLTEIELQAVRVALMHHEVESILAIAQDILTSGDTTRAQELFMQALKMEPENAIAREGLRKTQL